LHSFDLIHVSENSSTKCGLSSQKCKNVSIKTQNDSSLNEFKNFRF
jgi:hypothetical protein